MIEVLLINFFILFVQIILNFAVFNKFVDVYTNLIEKQNSYHHEISNKFLDLLVHYGDSDSENSENSENSDSDYEDSDYEDSDYEDNESGDYENKESDLGFYDKSE